MTIAMLSLAGIPGTVGFIGKFQLIHALVNGGYTWLGIVLVIGSMISLGYYLRVIAAMWMGGAESRGVGCGCRRRRSGGRWRRAGGSRGPSALRGVRPPGRLAPSAAGAPEAVGTGGLAALAAPAARWPRGHGGARSWRSSWSASVRGRQRVLRDLPLAAVQPRRPRRARARVALASPRGGSGRSRSRSASVAGRPGHGRSQSRLAGALRCAPPGVGHLSIGIRY